MKKWTRRDANEKIDKLIRLKRWDQIEVWDFKPIYAIINGLILSVKF